MKTIEQILNRIRELSNGGDFFCAQRNELLDFLPWKEDKEFITEDATEAEWKFKEINRENVIERIKDYMDFAFDKAMYQRGISASRSLDHFRALLWILEEEKEIDWGNYQNYGMPILKQIIEKYNIQCDKA